MLTILVLLLSVDKKVFKLSLSPHSHQNMISLLILSSLLSLASSCPGLLVAKQEGWRVENFTISKEGLVYHDEKWVDGISDCLDYLYVISPNEILYIVNGTLFHRAIGEGEDELDTNVSTVAYDEKTCTIYWIKDGKMYFEAPFEKTEGKLFSARQPLESDFLPLPEVSLPQDDPESRREFYIFVSIISVTICVCILVYRKLSLQQTSERRKPVPLVVLECDG